MFLTVGLSRIDDGKMDDSVECRADCVHLALVTTLILQSFIITTSCYAAYYVTGTLLNTLPETFT